METGLLRFAGKTAMVTAAGSGIGRAVALRLAEEGADVIVSDINAQTAQETGAMVTAMGRRALALACDMGSQDAIQQMTAAAFEGFEQVHILASCAGVGDSNKGFDEIDSELWDKIYAINVKGPFFLSRIVARRMIDQAMPGRIIFIASTEGKTNRGGTIVYSSSKHALVGLTQGLAFQLAAYGITVNSVCPGLIDTPAWHRGDQSMGVPEGTTVKMVVDASIESMQLKIPRVGQSAEVAGAVAFLASRDAEYMTGQAVNVCGGLEFR
ncbi:SDR family NAD(P)-dependent oxidoreductase [Thermodesulfobacteriota bacterium]